MRIESDTAAIEKNLFFLADTIKSHGGWVDEDLTIYSLDGAMRIIKEGFRNPLKPLIALPEDLMLPTDRLGLSVKNDQIDLSPDNGLSDIQIKLAETMIEIYNQTDKIKNHRDECCWTFYKDDPAPLESLVKARTINPSLQEQLDFTLGASETSEEEFLCNSYFNTRTIGHKQVNKDDEELVTTKDIMPIVDFLNHHPAGSMFSFGKNDNTDIDIKADRSLVVLDTRPQADSNECFVFYNQMDSVDTFLKYGFPDHNSPYIRSVPLEVELDGIGTIQIQSLFGVGVKILKKSMAALKPYIPSVISKTDDRLELSHVMIPTNNIVPNALRRSLRLVLSNWSASNGKQLKPQQVWEAIIEIEKRVIDENQKFYNNLKNEMAKSNQNEQVNRVAHLAELQATKLYKYNFDVSHYSGATQLEEANNAAE